MMILPFRAPGDSVRHSLYRTLRAASGCCKAVQAGLTPWLETELSARFFGPLCLPWMIETLRRAGDRT